MSLNTMASFCGGPRMIRLSPLSQRRLQNFRANRRAVWSFWIFLVLFVVSLFAELVANDKPFLVKFQGNYISPLLSDYPETHFGGDFLTPADYTDPFVQDLIRTNGDEEMAEGESAGWILWPLIPFQVRHGGLHRADCPFRAR